MNSEYPMPPSRTPNQITGGPTSPLSLSLAREHMSTTGEAIHVFNCPKVLQKWPISNIVKLLNSPADSRTLHPRVYRAAAADIFTVTLVLTWGITLIFHPEQIFDHPARKIIGSLNPCFGWDYPPASYIALLLCSCNVSLLWRYAWLEIVRTHMSAGGLPLSAAQRFAKWTAILLAASSNFWLLLWIVGPEDGNWFWHTAFFLLYAVASFLTCFGNYLEALDDPARRHYVTRRHHIYYAIFGFTTLLMPTVYFANSARRPPTRPPTAIRVPSGGSVHQSISPAGLLTAALPALKRVPSQSCFTTRRRHHCCRRRLRNRQTSCGLSACHSSGLRHRATARSR